MLNSKQRKTLQAIFDRPTRANIRWDDIEKLLLALGAEIDEKSGSAIRITLHGNKQFVHRPHPQKEAKRYVVDDIRTFLEELGIRP